MRELTTAEISHVSGAGWIKNELASLGGKLGASVWPNSDAPLNFTLPVIGKVTLPALPADIGKSLGSLVGSALGLSIESMLTSIPVAGIVIRFLLGD